MTVVEKKVVGVVEEETTVYVRQPAQAVPALASEAG